MGSTEALETSAEALGPPVANLKLSEIQNIASHASPPTITPIRPKSPSNQFKRSDPGQFGSRYLEDGDDVLEFNAWDNVDPAGDPLYVSYATQQYDFQRQHAVSDFDKHRFNSAPEKWWNQFYSNNEGNFFKDRKWLRKEFPVLAQCTALSETGLGADDSSEDKGGSMTGPRNIILEVGAGAGNTAFPLLAENANPSLFIHASDFSKKAVGLIRENSAYDPHHIRAEVWDIASATQKLPPGVEAGGVDVVLLIFVFSAISPRQWAQAVRNVWHALRPGGEVCFRDYGRGDLAQVRFKKGRYLGENFYVRGDGTRVYFFEEAELRQIWGGEVRAALGEAEEARGLEGDKVESETSAANTEILYEAQDVPAFEILHLGVDRRLLVNRQKQLKMYRCWMQGRFRKPSSSKQ